MEILGYFYEKSNERIPANGRPISKELINQGYVQKDNKEGFPRWYVKPNKVWLTLEINDKPASFNIYNNILAIYPDRKKVTLKLVKEVIYLILNGDINVYYRDGKVALIPNRTIK